MSTNPSTIALRTFVPAAEPITEADHMAADRLAREIFGALCVASLDVPAELYLGHTGTGQCHGGAIQDAFYSFSVRNLSLGLETLHATLAAHSIAREHYETATRSEACHSLFASDWVPAGRTSALHGLSQDDLLNRMRSRLDSFGVFVDAHCETAVTAIKELRQSIQTAMESRRRLVQSQRELNENVKTLITDIEKNIRASLPLWPETPPASRMERFFQWLHFKGARTKCFLKVHALAQKIVAELLPSPEPLVCRFGESLQAFMRAPANTPAAQRAALQKLQQALAHILAELPEA
jgi:hypothetical protein